MKRLPVIPTARILAPVLALLVLLVAAPSPAAADPAGTLDPTFGTGGAVVARDYELVGALVSSGPRAYVAGMRKTTASAPAAYAVVGLADSGAPDPTFGTGGAVVMPDRIGAGQLDLAPAPGGAVYVTQTTIGYLLVTKLGPSGAADPSFGVSGIRPLPLALGDVSIWWYELQADPLGALTFVGIASGPAFTRHLVLVRLTPSGDPDASFGAGGLGAFPLDPNQFEIPSGLAVDSLGRSIVVLESGDTSRASFVLRFTAAGAIDPAFGTGGIAIPTRGIHAIEAAADATGGVVLLGNQRFAATAADTIPVLARLQPNGSPDLAFGSGGVVGLPRTEGVRTWGSGLRLDGAGRAVFTFSSFTVAQGPVLAGVVRVDAGGALDPAFGFGAGAGVAAWPTSTIFTGLAVDSADRVLVAGALADPGGTGCPPACTSLLALRLRAA